MPQKKDLNIWAIVPAAGIGSRMQSAIPKQYLALLGKTLIDNTLEKLLALDELSGVILALHADDHYWKQCYFFDHPKIRCVAGGSERSDSVINALDLCRREYESDTSWALVHDAARPCVSLDKIRELIAYGLSCHAQGQALGAILAVRASDTVKRVSGNTILNTEDRTTLWLAQTPQFFPTNILFDALRECRRKDILVTDESSAMEAMGHKVCVLEDRRDNIKVTLPEDLRWAESILNMQTDTIKKDRGET